MSKTTELIDHNDLKVKHKSGQYASLPHAPQPDDILFFLYEGNKKKIKTTDLLKKFGRDSYSHIQDSLNFLVSTERLKEAEREEIMLANDHHWWADREGEVIFIARPKDKEVSERDEEAMPLVHLGIASSKSAPQSEGQDLFDKWTEGEEVDRGILELRTFEVLSHS